MKGGSAGSRAAVLKGPDRRPTHAPTPTCHLSLTWGGGQISRMPSERTVTVAEVGAGFSSSWFLGELGRT